jgi:hypothetical protein
MPPARATARSRAPDSEASAPSEIWQADHTQLDILIVDEHGSAVRPWLTVKRGSGPPPMASRRTGNMYDELGGDGGRARTVQQIADEFGVTRPTFYRDLQGHTDWPDLSVPTCLLVPVP